jgi:hypothetical protein
LLILVYYLELLELPLPEEDEEPLPRPEPPEREEVNLPRELRLVFMVLFFIVIKWIIIFL